MMFEYYVGDPQVPIASFENPFTDLTTGSNCTLPPRFFERELGCNLLTNFGVGTIIIYATLAINIAISVAYYVIYSVRINVHKQRDDKEKIEQIKSTRGYKVLSWFTRYYGIRFFRIRLEGIAIELLIYSMINILSEFEQSSLTFGAILSYLYLLYFVVSNIYTYMVVREVYPILKEKQDILKSANEAYIFPPTETVDIVVNIAELKYGAYDLFLHEYTANINPLLVYAPFISLSRVFSIVLVLFCFSRAGIVQVFCVMAIEISYMVFLFKSNFRANRYEHYLTLFMQFGYILYAFLSLLTFLPTDQNTKQLYIGFTMAATMIALTYVTLIYVFSIFVYKVIYLPIQLLYHKYYIKSQLNKGRPVRENSVIVWDNKGMPIKEEIKAVTVKDLLDKKKHETQKQAERDKNKGLHNEPDTLKDVWKDDHGDDEVANLKASTNLNQVAPLTRKSKGDTHLIAPVDGKKPIDDIEDTMSAKGSIKSTQNTAPHKIALKNRLKKPILKPTMPEGAKLEAKNVFTFDRAKRKEVP